MQQRFLLQILLLAQHVSGNTVPIIRSSRVLYGGCCLWYFVLWFSSCWSSWHFISTYYGILFPHIMAFYFHILTTMHGQDHIKKVYTLIECTR